jgi:predicted DsbA family dithiol-disulfide isomerase
VYRLRQLQTDGVRFEWASLPIEVVNRRGTPKDILDHEVEAIQQIEPRLEMRRWAKRDWEWPVTMLPAFEAVKCAEAQGDDQAGEYQWRVRQAFFRDSACISLRHVLLDLAEELRLDATRFAEDLDSGRFRQQVMAESHAGWQVLKVRGSPTFVLPDGSVSAYPGLPEVAWSADHRIERIEPPPEDPMQVLQRLVHQASSASSSARNP